jgi:YfiH family protein
MLPQPSGEFEWVQESWGAALRCRPLAEAAAHCFSTRDLSLDGTAAQNRERWEEVAVALGIDDRGLLRMRQVHHVDVVEAPAGTTPAFAVCSPDDWPQGDIAVSSDPLHAVSVRTADCVPILLADRRGKSVAAVHAGWKGTAAGAAAVAVQALFSRYGTNPDDITAAVGPSIGPCCYEVSPELVERFSAHPEASSWFSRDAKPRLDLWRATRDQLIRAGVQARHIHVCRLCTRDHASLFHSYRRDGVRAGRLVAAIRSAPDKTP